MKIEICVPPDKQTDKIFIQLLAKAEAYFNGPDFQKDKVDIVMHEGLHLMMARKIGFEPGCYGPMIIFDREANDFELWKASVEKVPDTCECSPVDWAKVAIAPSILFDGSSRDIQLLEKFCQLKNLDYDEVYGLAYSEVIRDMLAPSFSMELVKAAAEFEARVFPG